MKPLWAALVLAAMSAPLRAAPPAIPPGEPSAQRKEAAMAAAGLPVSQYLVSCFGYTPQSWDALSADEKLRVGRWMRILYYENWRQSEYIAKRLVDGEPFVPVGAPPPERLAPVSKDFEFYEGDLAGYGYAAADYRKLDAPERQRIADWIRIFEYERMHAANSVTRVKPLSLKYKPNLFPIVTAAPADPGPLKLDPAGDASLARIRAAEGGAAFDGAAGAGGTGTGSAPLRYKPFVELFGPVAPIDGTTPPYGGVRRFGFTGPDDFRVEGGYLGLDGRSPLVAPSPYGNIYKGWSGSNGSVDYSVRGQAAVINLGARLYYDRTAIDDRIDAGLATLKTLDPTLGITPDRANWVANQFRYSTNFEQQWLFVGSLLGRVGRAYPVLPGMDLAWSAMGEIRADQYFPNATLDQTVGNRLHLGDDRYLGFFWGVTEGIGVLNRSVIVDSLSSNSFKTNVHPEAAPHFSIGSWGKMPYLSSVEYSVTANQQWNPWTTVRSVTGSVGAPVGGTKVSVFGSYSDESGPAIEFQRRKASAGLIVSPSPFVDLSLAYGNDKAVYGDAQVENHGVYFGLTVREAGGPGAGASVTMDSLFDGRDHLLTQSQQSQLVKDVQDALNLIRRIKDDGLHAVGGASAAWRDLQLAWAILPPDVKALINGAYNSINPGGTSLDKIIAINPSTWDDVNKLINLLGDTQVLERLLVRYVRAQILKQLESVDIPVIGKVHMTAPMVLAAAHAYSLGLSPVPPITSADARNGLDPYILNKVSSQFGCKTGTQPQATTDCILSPLPDNVRDDIKKQYGADINDILKAAVSWPSDVIRREMNQLLLQVFLASETLNQLTVDQGTKIGDLNVRGMMASFQYLDERTRKENSRIFSSARAEVADDLSVVDARMRDTLSEYGAQRLAWLQSQAAWPGNVKVSVKPEDWAPLLAIYGDKALFDLILKAKGALSCKTGSHTLIVTLDRASQLGGIIVQSGEPAIIKLPTKKVDLSVFDFSYL